MKSSEYFRKGRVIPLPPFKAHSRLTPLEEELIKTKIVQRLRGIKQLGLAYLVYPQATHDRFAHAIATAHIVKEIFSKSYVRISEDQKNLLLATAILHDIGHTPFSHVLETFFQRRGYCSHVEWTAAIVEGKEEFKRYADEKHTTQNILKKYRVSPNDVGKLIMQQYRNKETFYLQEILFGSIDADVLAYLIIDAWHTIGEVPLDIDRVIRFLLVSDGKLCVLDKALPSINAIFVLRNAMYKQVYLHHTTRVADAMLKTAMSLALDEIPNFYELDDSELFVKLLESKNEVVREIAERIRYRKLLKRAFYKKSFDIKPGSEEYAKLDRLQSLISKGEFDLREEIARKVKGLRKELIIVDFPLQSLLFSEPRFLGLDFNVYLERENKIVKVSDLTPKTIEAYLVEGCRPEYLFIIAVPEEYVEKAGKVMEEIWDWMIV